MGGGSRDMASCVKLALCADIQHTAPGTHGHGQACKGQRNALAIVLARDWGVPRAP